MKETKQNSLKKAALEYHEAGRPGKIEVIPTKETANQRDLSLAYSPGVAEPCLQIAKNIEDAYRYTTKGNLVAVITNGTAVLGLGNIGPAASKPVMEGKGLLFKIYADIDCFDLELNTTDVDEFVRTVKLLEPTFGGVNLEDIAAPHCFTIEERLKQELNIPVMHDDQHGTAIISAAALLNALEIVKKEISDVRVIVSGAGAAAISCIRMWLKIGVRKENIIMFDIAGQISTDRNDLSPYQKEFANQPMYSNISEAMTGADVFLGLSAGNIISKDMVRSMAKDPIVFALANPTPEISYNDARSARPDCLVATGRSDYPNQVNNVLGFPYIFRGALDVRATEINEEMKLGAAYALAELAKKPVPDLVNMAYNDIDLRFGRDYFIPKPVDPRLITTLAPAVAKAAMDSGVAKNPIKDWDQYTAELDMRLGTGHSLSKVIENKAKQDLKRIVFADAENVSLLKAVQVIVEEKIALPILLGKKPIIQQMMKDYNINLPGVPIIDPKQPDGKKEEAKIEEYGKILYRKRMRKGLTHEECLDHVRYRSHYGALMIENGDADGMIGGLTKKFPTTVRPALQIVGARPDVKKVAGMHILMTKNGPVFIADTTINHHLNAHDISNITELVAAEVRRFDIEPRIALITYSNFGSVPNGESAVLMREATRILHEKHPDWMLDGEMQAHMALNPEIRKSFYPFSKLKDLRANTLIFPNLSSANIAYNMLGSISDTDIIGPILLGLKKSIHVLQLGASVRQIVDMVGIAAIHAQNQK
ncbi:NADP-dependent malic enzyme [Portibacter marinus]|uniref:NADP-dependent malic enzyme n=1 Tax=Portibacter marinus TaxID=2898660 RepID=UPI0029E7FFE0|nr:NADP-dependent malic enzyme [Portibacter marinus]